VQHGSRNQSSHSATNQPVTPTRAAEWLSGCGSNYVRVFRYIRNLSPVKFLTTRIVCGVAASEFVLAASEFIFFAGSDLG